MAIECAYPNDTYGEHDHAACLDVIEERPPKGENMPHPILSLLRDEEDLAATLTIAVQYDGERDRFHIGVQHLDNGRRSLASTWVEVPKGGDLAEIGGVLRDLAYAWLMAPNFVPGLVLRVAVLDHFTCRD